MTDFKILRPAFLSDFNANAMPQQIMFVGKMNFPCPLLIELFNGETTIWVYPDVQLIVGTKKFVIDDMQSIPTNKEWLLNYLYLEPNERSKAMKNKLEWQFVFEIYQYSKICGRDKIIIPFWTIAKKLQVVLNVLLMAKTKEQHVQILNQLVEMNRQVNNLIDVNTKARTQYECDVLQVIAFLGRPMEYCLTKIK